MVTSVPSYLFLLEISNFLQIATCKESGSGQASSTTDSVHSRAIFAPIHEHELASANHASRILRREKRGAIQEQAGGQLVSGETRWQMQKNHRSDDIIDPCRWRETKDCDPNGVRELASDGFCNESISAGRSGFCDCDGNGERADGEPGYACASSPGTCIRACESVLNTEVCAEEGEMCGCEGTVFYGKKFRVGQPGSGQMTTFEELKGIPHVCAEEGQNCSCNGKVYYGNKFKNGNGGDQTTFEDMLGGVHASMASTSEMACSADLFYSSGADPSEGTSRYCYCETFDYRELSDVTGFVPCSIAAFGDDPLPGHTKYCYCRGVHTR